MKKIILGLGVAASAIATPAMARDGQGYFGADVGLVFPNETNVAVTGLTGGGQVEDAALFEHNKGWAVGGQLGYDFGPIRTEVELSYQEFDPERITSNVLGVPHTNPQLAPRTGVFNADGETRLTSLMANALLDFGGEDGIGFSIGGGAGHTWLGQNMRTFVNGPGYFDDQTRDHVWAWQGIAQLRVPVTENAELGLKYKYFNTQEFNVRDTLGRDHEFDVSTHQALISLLVNFGGSDPVVAPPPPPPAPPRVAPPPPPPAAPAPAPQMVCNQGPYIVFFDWDQDVVTPEAATVLNSAVTAYGNCGTVPIMLAGYTDLSGSKSYNMNLAGRRNANVTEYLTGRGIPAARIAGEAFGEANPRVPTSDGVRELQNRRVEITYGPGSGR